MNLKKFFPDLGAFSRTNWSQPAIGKSNAVGTVMMLLVLAMAVFVFLPWFHYEYIKLQSDGSASIEAFNALGITTLWGILGLAVTVVAAYGVLYRQYAFSLWSGIAAIIFGYLGTIYVTNVEIEANNTVILKEAFKMEQLLDEGLPVSHVGARLFMIAAALVTSLSLVQLLKRDEEPCEKSCLAKIALAVAIFVATVICLDAALVTPTFLSIIAAKMIVWNLPLIAILLVVVAYFKGESKNTCMLSTALLVVAFFFTNPATIVTKYVHKAGKETTPISRFYNISHDSRVIEDSDDYKDLRKDAVKNARDVLDEKRMPIMNCSRTVHENKNMKDYDFSRLNASDLIDDKMDNEYYDYRY